ncbi:MAG: DUF2339 domain-containing protein [Usitatibacter sp.]
MIWILPVIGALVGAAYWGFPGAVTLGFLGWLAAVIMKSGKPAKPASPPAGEWARFEALDRRIALLEARLARVEARGGAGEIAAVEQAVEAAAPLVAPSPVPAPPAEIAGAAESAAAVASTPAAHEPHAAPRPAQTAKPNLIAAWFTGGNTIVRVGLVILFLGLAFLVKYGVEHQLVPVELRVAAVGAAGLALLVIGWRLRGRRPEYALSLQGAGVGVLYLTIFGALRLYGLLPAGAAFALLAAIAALSAFLAVAQESLALAVFGAAGGFLAPILASTGGGSHVMLFSYYLLLNAGIVAVAWFRAWRVLNVVGFLFTFLIALAWGLRSYRPELFDTTEPFLVAFFLAYVGIAILFARNRAPMHRDYVDGIIVFGTPIAAFGLQAGLMRDSEFGLAYSSIAASALYLALAAALRRVGRERWALLSEAFLALGVVFATLAIPLALDARWTSAAWAIEGAAVVWIGARQRRTLARAFGALLELAAGIAFFRAYAQLPPGPPLADATFVGALLLSFAGLWTQRVLARGGESITGEEKSLAPLFFLWGLGWWLYAGAHEVHAFIDAAYRLAVFVAFIAGTALGFEVLARRREWSEARWPGRALAPALLALAIASFLTRSHPAAGFGWLAWPFALACHFIVLRSDEESLHGTWASALHVLGIVVIAFLGATELEWIAAENTAPGTAWSLAARLVVPAILMLAISSRAADTRWPVASHVGAYRLGAVLTLAAAMGLWSLHINASHGGASSPLPYIPLLNAIDLAHLLAALALASAWLALRRSGLELPAALRGAMGIGLGVAIAFTWLNAVLLRTLHHWRNIPYNFRDLSASVEVHAALSVFWTFLALATMIVATRVGRRAPWMAGAALMAVVVAKLVLVDLSHLAGIERIVSFIGVGLLMLVIGYFSPVPPRTPQAPA